MIAELTGRCAGCGKVWKEEDLSEIHDFWGRVLAGYVMPLGQCPECEMLCYVERDEDKIIVETIGGAFHQICNLPVGLRIDVMESPSE